MCYMSRASHPPPSPLRQSAIWWSVQILKFLIIQNAQTHGIKQCLVYFYLSQSEEPNVNKLVRLHTAVRGKSKPDRSARDNSTVWTCYCWSTVENKNMEMLEGAFLVSDSLRVPLTGWAPQALKERIEIVDHTNVNDKLCPISTEVGEGKG